MIWIEEDAPIARMLQAADGRVRFHMPGHKGLLLSEDMTELSVTDDLYAPSSGIAEAERLAAKACGAARTILLTGGATAGLLAMLLSSIPPGNKVILSRNAHHAALSACVWGDLDAVFTDDPARSIKEHPDARAVLVTRPDYYGMCGDLAPLSRLARERGMLLLVDEAHGAHFAWWDTPESAGRLGADAWVQSAHKTLPALTGAAWLHLGETMDQDRARRFLRMVQTSSPPFPILQSLDSARAWMDAHGAKALKALKASLAGLRERIAALGYANVPSDDPTRLVIGTRGRGMTGLQAQALLMDRGVDVEMADDRCVVCITTVADTPQSFQRLYEALAALPAGAPLPACESERPKPGPRAMGLRQAALAEQEAVPLCMAAGRVASTGAGMYPPGIPFVLPGERITEACAARLSALPPSRRFGVENDRLICVK